MKSFWCHHEGTETWRQPRHPVVAIGDMIVAICITILAVFVAESWNEKLYYFGLVGLLVVSSTHHWVREKDLLRWLDHVMIFVSITFTTAPYWPLTLTDPNIRLIIWFGILATIFIGGVWKFTGSKNRTLSLCVFILSGWPVAILLLSPFLPMNNFWELFGGLNTVGGWCFFLGMLCYLKNGIIFTREWCNFYPDQFGYREVQHQVLYLAMALHIVALNTI